jgi:hypothetical protein
MSKWTVTWTFKINLPDRQTHEFDDILNRIEEDEPDFFPMQDWDNDLKAGILTQADIDEMEEEMMATWIASQVVGGDMTEYGELTDEESYKDNTNSPSEVESDRA